MTPQLLMLLFLCNQDVASLTPIAATDSYFFGKVAARAARLALIAEEVGLHDQIAAVSSFLVSSLTPWMDGTLAGNGFRYDTTWGGVITQNGAADPVVNPHNPLDSPTPFPMLTLA